MSPHRTLVFCTSHVDDHTVWDGRYRRWFDGVDASGIAHDTALMIDDGSSSVPDWPDLTILREGEDGRDLSPKMLYRFAENLGRRSLFDFPGWHRSFTFACRFADRHGFDKVVHVESDAFVISRRLRDYIDAAQDDWIALWCPLHGFPEITIQIMAGSGLAACRAFSDVPHAALVGRPYEGQLPFTRIEKGFIGDRYGERLPYVPIDADFVSQAPEADRSYFWWFPAGAGDVGAISEDGAPATRMASLLRQNEMLRHDRGRLQAMIYALQDEVAGLRRASASEPRGLRTWLAALGRRAPASLSARLPKTRR